MQPIEHQPSAAGASASQSRDRHEPEDCWSRIGDGGDATCPELPKFLCCRNCPVYSKAGAQLLDRALAPEYRREWTERFAQEKKPAVRARISAVLFRIQSEWLALPAQVFQEIAEHRLIHSLPHRRQGIVLGLANIRGELLICFSLGRLLGLQSPAGPEKLRGAGHRLLVVGWDADRFVFPVGEVQGIHRFHQEELKEPPSTARSNTAYAQGIFLWRERAAGFLEPERLFAALNRSLSQS